MDFGRTLDVRKAVGYRWIFKRKTDVDSSVTIYKARIVAKGFRQVQGVDYDESFSLVSMLKSVQIMLAIATFYDCEIRQMDVKTTFINGFLKEELYMMQPEGFVDPKNADKVCKLQRSIYGLVQASRSWNIRFDEMNQSVWVYADLWRSLCLQESEWERCSISHIICR